MFFGKEDEGANLGGPWRIWLDGSTRAKRFFGSEGGANKEKEGENSRPHWQPFGFGTWHAQRFLGGEGRVNWRFLQPMLLLLLAEEPCHGYELIGKLKEFGIDPGQMHPSILYRWLRQLEVGGLAESSLDDSGSGPARKVYKLTPEGRELLDLWVVSMDGLSAFIKSFKERYQKLKG